MNNAGSRKKRENERKNAMEEEEKNEQTKSKKNLFPGSIPSLI